jgi:protein SCO1
MKTLATMLFLFVWMVGRVVALSSSDLSSVRFEQHSGQQISRDVGFQDEAGQAITLGELLGKRPAILLLGYYRCPMLCSMVDDGLINALQNLRANVGTDLDVIEVSIDPSESVRAAAEKKALHLRLYGRSGAGGGWHCLVGDEKSISQLADEVGYRYAYDPQSNQYAHPSGVIILTSEGRISRYVFGVTFNSSELRDALIAAKEGKSETVLSRIVLLCYHYNPITGKYGATILSILRVASVGFVCLIACWLIGMVRHPSNHAAQTK